MEDYYFIFKDSLGNWNTCTNPVFIAAHTCCRAIKKSKLSSPEKLKYIIKKMSSRLDNCARREIIKKYNL